MSVNCSSWQTNNHNRRYREASLSAAVGSHTADGPGVGRQHFRHQQGVAASFIHNDFMPCVLADLLAPLVPDNLRSRSASDPAGEAHLVSFHAGQVGGCLEEARGQGGLLWVLALAVAGVSGPRSTLSRGIWLKVLLTAQINMEISPRIYRSFPPSS